MQKIIQQLKKSERILLATHANPDGDAIGSLMALGLALLALEKPLVTLFNDSPIPAVYRFLPGVERIECKISDGAAYDTAVVLDCSDLQRVGSAEGTVRRVPVVINIDHHISNTGFGTLRLIEVEACATAEIVYKLIQAVPLPLNKAIATSIYTGILADTGSFRFSNTNRTAFAICEQMVGLGVDPYTVAQEVYGTYSLGRIKLLNLALDSIEVSANGKLSLMTLTQAMMQETGTKPQDIDGLINYAKGIKDVEVAILIQEEKENGRESRDTQRPFHVSLRSNGRIDVAAIATSFGGGGHFSAAGFNLKATLPELKQKIFAISETI